MIVPYGKCLYLCITFMTIKPLQPVPAIEKLNFIFSRIAKNKL